MNTPRPGEIYCNQPDNPFDTGTKVKILDVKDGWVLYTYWSEEHKEWIGSNSMSFLMFNKYSSYQLVPPAPKWSWRDLCSAEQQAYAF